MTFPIRSIDLFCRTCDRGIDKTEWHECPVCKQEICDECAWTHLEQVHDKTDEEVEEIMQW